MSDVMVSTITFDVRRDTRRGIHWITPLIDGQSLVHLVGEHESAHGYKPAGSYDGMVPDYFDFGDFASYYLGIETDQWPERGRLGLIDCECGQAGCWPLEASALVTTELVTWSDFAQLHKPAWSYAGFGPFSFDRAQYEAAFAACIAVLDAVYTECD